MRSCGGASVSYALEHCPRKISKAIFLTDAMLASADIFLQESRFLLYGNGKDKPHTGLMFDKQQIKGLYFNQSPSKDIALAAMSMRPIPLAQSWRSSPSPATLFPVKAKTEEESTEKS